MRRGRTYKQELADRSIGRMQQLMAEAPITYRELAITLHKEGHRTIRDCRWTVPNIKQVVHRLRNDYSRFDEVGYGAAMAKATPQLWCLQ